MTQRLVEQVLPDRRQRPKLIQNVPSKTRQILVVADPISGVLTVVHPMERGRHGWAAALSPIDAVVGRNGIALPGAKREGDGKTPSGLFPFEGAFGYSPHIVTKMAYRQTGDDDVWVDNPCSPDYNTWQMAGDTARVSAEAMRRADNLYEYGLLIGYNRNPAIKGLGSAIFFHVWKGRGIPTSGCVAMVRDNMIAILAWLDPVHYPLAVIGGWQKRLKPRGGVERHTSPRQTW